MVCGRVRGCGLHPILVQVAGWVRGHKPYRAYSWVRGHEPYRAYSWVRGHKPYRAYRPLEGSAHLSVIWLESVRLPSLL